MDVQTGLAVIAKRDIPNRAKHLTLLVHGNLFVRLLGEIKPANRSAFESANGGKRRRSYTGFARETLETGESLVATIQDKNAGVQRTGGVDVLALHGRLLCRHETPGAKRSFFARHQKSDGEGLTRV
jgi:hypothetical protein